MISAQHNRSEALAVSSRNRASTSLAWSIGCSTRPATTSGPCGCAWNSNDVTTPKLPPPPRIAQNRSGFSVGARPAHLPIGGDDLDGAKIVGGKPMAARHPAEPAAEREAGDAGRRDDPAGHHEAQRLRRAIDVGPGGARLHAHAPGRRIDRDLLVGREIDHHAAIAQRGAGDVVAAAADRQREATIARQPDAGGHVTGVRGRTASAGRRSIIRSRSGTPRRRRIAGPERGAAQARGERFQTVSVTLDGRGTNGAASVMAVLPRMCLAANSIAGSFPRRRAEDKCKICTSRRFRGGRMVVA